MRGLSHHQRSSRVRLLLLPLLFACAWCCPPAARATFHLNEISRVMTSHNGDVAVQAVELKMIIGGEHLVNGTSLVAYDGAGNQVAVLGTFGADLPAAGSIAGARILLATMKWRQRFGVTPDLQISAGLLPTSGQVVLRTPTCFINAVAYGDVSTFVAGTTAAPPLPTEGAPVLVRIQDNATSPFCPMAENAAQKFQFRTASETFPVFFTNYSGVSVGVFSTVTGVGETAGSPARPRAYPNPFRQSIRIESPSAEWIGVFDVRGSLVRVVHQSRTATASYRGDWDGRDEGGSPVPAGVYFIRHGRGAGAPVSRVALLR